MRRLALLGLAIVAIPLVVGCGSSNSTEAEVVVNKTLSCDPPSGHIELHDSGISCEQAAAMLILLDSGKSPQQIESSSGEIWTCRKFPPSKAPLHLRCARGARFFTVESTA